MIKTAEYVSLGHPDKTADYITSYILDRFLEHDAAAHYGVEVMIKDNTVVLGGEIRSTFCPKDYAVYVKSALREIGYDERYASIWGEKSLNINRLKVINLINCQSAEIALGVDNDGWGDQGIFVGYACQGRGYINKELYLARKLNNALYKYAQKSDVLGIDIKTQITLNNEEIETAIVAIPMLEKVDVSDLVISILQQEPKNLIINGTGNYTIHSAIADCGMSGRKLACDFYAAASPIGGGSPWTKDAGKADLTLNLYARQLALKNLADNDEVWVYLSSCIGRSALSSAIIKTRKGNIVNENVLQISANPSVLIKSLGLDKPIYADMCRQGFIKI